MVFPIHPHGVAIFEITNCDFKAGTWRAAFTALGVHGTWRGDAGERAAFRRGGAGECVEIIRVFVRLRRLQATPGEVVEQLAKLAGTVRLHDDQIKAIAQVLRQLMDKPAEPRKGRIGFHSPAAE